VKQHGQIKWKGGFVYLSRALWGQEIGLKPLSEGKWGVYFEDYELGVLDERTSKIKGAKRLISSITSACE